MTHKRKRGGQPGNQNARKHGLYSLVATPAQRRAISNKAKVNTIEQEIALLRAKINTSLKFDPKNVGAVSNAAAVIGRLVRLQGKIKKFPSLFSNVCVENPAPDSRRNSISDTCQINLRTNEPA